MNKITKTIISAVVLVLASLPTDFFLLIKSLLNPAGFWEQFVVYGVGIYVLGGLQLVFLILWIVAVVSIWNN
jgi:hypothetical protein